MNANNLIRNVLSVALLLGLLGGISFAHGITTGSSGGSYYAVLGSNVSGASTIYFTVPITNLNPGSSGSYTDQLVMVGNPNQVVNQTTVAYSGSQTTVVLSYTFSRVGTYQLYSSISDNLGDVSNAPMTTVTVLQGLTARMAPQSQSSAEGQSDSLNVNITDNLLMIPGNGEPSTQYYIFKVVQTAPGGASTTIAVNTSGNSGIAYGQPYHGSYSIPVPAFSQAGTYSYTISIHSTAAGTNTTASASISVAAGPVTTSTSTSSTTTVSTTASTTASTSASTTLPTTTTISPSSPFNCTSSGGTYYVILGSNVPGASSLFFTVPVTNRDGNSGDTYSAKLVLMGSHNLVVNQTTVPQSGRVTTIEMSYTFGSVGTYTLYTSVTDAHGFTVNTPITTAYVLQGLSARAALSNMAPQQYQSDSINLNITDNFGDIPSGGEGSIYYFKYNVIQTAPNGAVTTVASNTATNANGQPYFGGYNIALPQFAQSGSYNYRILVYDQIGGLNATATASVSVTPVTLASNTLTLSIPSSALQVGQNELVQAVPDGPGTPTSYSWTLNGNALPPTGNSITFNANSSTLGTDLIAVTGTYPGGQTASAQGTITVTTTPPATTTTTTVPQNSGGSGANGGGCGLCVSGSGGGRPASTVTTTIRATTTAPATTTIPPSSRIVTAVTQTGSNQSGTPASSTVTSSKPPSSGFVPPSLTTSLFIAIIALLLIVLALVLMLGKKGDRIAASSGKTQADTEDTPE